MTIDQVIAAGAAEDPDRVAAIGDCGQLTYGEFDALADRIAHTLLAGGLSAGDRVVVHLANSPEYLALYCGLARAGLVVVPLNRRSAVAEAIAVVEDCAATCLVTAADEPVGRELADGTPRFELSVVIDTTLPGGRGWWDAFGAAPPEPLARSTPAPSLDQIQSIHYTSGTTGGPKGVVRTHASNLAVAENALRALAAGSNDRWLHTLPFYSVGVYAFALPALMAGASVVIPGDLDPLNVLTLARAHDVTVMHAVPTLWEMVRQAASQRNLSRPAGLHTALWGGSPMPEPVASALAAWLGMPCRGVYGSTEIPCIAYATSDASTRRFDASGVPVGDTRARLRSAVDCPDGVRQGELELCGSSLMSGYLNQPEATAEVVDSDGWFRTGDWAQIDADGTITVTDRTKDMIITGGHNVYPGEVENAIASMAEVAEVSVLGVSDPLWGQRVVAVVVPQKGCVVTAETVALALDGRVSRYKLPRSVIAVDSLPRNALGKVVKSELLPLFDPEPS